MVGTWLYTTYCPLSFETVSGSYNFLKQLLNSNGFFSELETLNSTFLTLVVYSMLYMYVG